MRKIFIALVVFGVVFSLVVPCFAAGKFAAKVNGNGIKKATLDAAVNNFIKNQERFGVKFKEEDKANLANGILEELIVAELLYDASKKAKLGNLKEEINKEYENIKKGFPSEDEFKKTLKEKGVSEKELRSDITKGVYIKNYLDKHVYNKIKVDEKEKKKEYNANLDKLNVPELVSASHILIKLKKDATDSDKKKALEKIKDLRKRALGGEDFEKLAKENSEDTSAEKGGVLKDFSRKDVVKPFSDAAFSLKVGEISDVVETQFGYHIIKLLGKKAPRTLTYKEVEKDVENFLSNKKKKEALDKKVEELKKKAKIERY